MKRNPLLMAAIGLALCGPAYAADTAPATTAPTAEAERLVNEQSTYGTTVADGDTDRQELSDSTDGKDADDSSRNARDRDGDTMTPMDQSNSEADVDITRQIRSTLVEDDSLGTDAKNVKVITVDGKVTLRGPVETEVEHARVVGVAEQVAGADHVTDEIEIARE